MTDQEWERTKQWAEFPAMAFGAEIVASLSLFVSMLFRGWWWYAAACLVLGIIGFIGFVCVQQARREVERGRGMTCEWCGNVFGPNDPPDGWEIKDGGKICTMCNAKDLNRFASDLIERHKRECK